MSPASTKVSWKLLTSKGDLIGWPGNYFAWGFLFNQPYEIFFLKLNLRLPWEACPHVALLKGKPPKARNIPKLNSRQTCFNYLTEIHRRNNLISPLHGKECSSWYSFSRAHSQDSVRIPLPCSYHVSPQQILQHAALIDFQGKQTQKYS